MDFTATHLTAILVALITGIVSPLTMHFVSYLAKKSQKNKKYSLDNKQYIKRDELILKKIEDMRQKYSVDRVWIAEFHNGNKTYSGKSFQKFSTTFETTKTGIAPEAFSTQAIPASIFSHFFRKLSEQGYYFSPDTLIEKDSISEVMSGFWETRGIKSFVSVAIKDISGNFVGILCMDGVVSRLELKKEDIESLMSAASGLAGYLE